IRPLNAQPNPEIQIGFRQFVHVTLTHPVVSEKTTCRSDPYLGFWTPGFCVLTIYICLTVFLDPSFECPTQSGDPNWILSVSTRQFNPPGRVGENGTSIGSLFGILDPRVIRHFNAQPNPEIQIGFRQFAHVTLTHPVVWEKTARRSDPYLGFWTPGLCVLTLYM
ncbi:hypothetical protein Taro_033459, partial [Colocasia esculenta]|nr:hypothetical protein [Colocasia esculenta]